MRIGIYALDCGPENGGVFVYLVNLLNGLGRSGSPHEFYVFFKDRSLEHALEPGLTERIRVIQISALRISVARTLLRLATQPVLFLKLAARAMVKQVSGSGLSEIVDPGLRTPFLNLAKYRLDVLHFPSTMIEPAFLGLDVPIVLTVHDIQQEYLPELFSREELAFRHTRYRVSCERADLILSVSEYTRSCLNEKYGVPLSKVQVTFEGCSPRFLEEPDGTDLAAARARYGLPPEYLFYPASTWPHKNHLKLLEALDRLRREEQLTPSLVLTGFSREARSQVEDRLRELELKDQVYLLGHIPQAEMPLLYRMATALVFPSLFEGFGIPLVEAMSTGLPIVCADRTAVPEIAGPAGLYFDPQDPDDMARKIATVLRDRELRKKLVAAGYDQVRKFGWDAVTQATLSAYEAVRKTE